MWWRKEFLSLIHIFYIISHSDGVKEKEENNFIGSHMTQVAVQLKE